MDEVTTIQIRKSTRKRIDKFQKKKKLRTRDDAVNELLDKVEQQS